MAEGLALAFGELHVQQWERVALAVERGTPGDFKPVVAVKTAGLRVLFINVQLQLVMQGFRMLQQCFADAFAALILIDKQHFHFVAAQSDKTAGLAGAVHGNPNVDRRQVIVQHQRIEFGDVFFGKKMVGSAYRTLSNLHQLRIVFCRASSDSEHGNSRIWTHLF